MTGIRDAATKRKLLSLVPFTAAQVAVNLCRSEESARANVGTLQGTADISAVHHQLQPANPHMQQQGRGAASPATAGLIATNPARQPDRPAEVSAPCR